MYPLLFWCYKKKIPPRSNTKQQQLQLKIKKSMHPYLFFPAHCPEKNHQQLSFSFLQFTNINSWLAIENKNIRLKDNKWKYYQRKKTRDDETYKLLYPVCLQFFFSSFSSQPYLLNYYKKMEVTSNLNLPIQHFPAEVASDTWYPPFVSHIFELETEAYGVSVQSTCIAA